ncbi:hypothetical protein AL036_00075 [Salipiger aestuarii]|uniref:Uncharacterized protein n=1 Tax=Salipiger aestuarii TaxID=568098 RepID=A0A327YUY9_9RHOB|nr:DUF1223 domain-containing protein [Salipiger aestuarii]EIE48930.1 hypothetical protein C357_22260 [Citreicella sp. 357]KAA8610321.1 hypothetical protein AL036_00075 [Salipiger aestuarii]KAA8616336.1 hypothetical protein AL037_00075 [Salipiger aestuarii]KAB2543569.1 hypothetical protein AL035_01915 [Salipiger aestuarii]RAK21859.1 hypothetical protein ATI53_100315 [Salipiger aestuarii]
MYRLTSWIATTCLAVAGSATLAQERSRDHDSPVVVELFTSQGCISCPAADAVLAELGQRDDVIALALHVDYWDYIGWRDSFGDPAFTKRQKGYARAAGRRSIYTPQMMIGGAFDVVGSRPMKVMDAVQHALDAPALATLTITRDGDMLLIRADPLGPLPETLVHLVRYTPRATVDITAGENEGRTVFYTHIAHGWQVLGLWNGEAPLEMQAEVTGDDPVVVILQEKGYGPILAASRLR